MLFNLLLADITIENARLKLALAIPTGAPTTVANDAMEMLPLIRDRRTKNLSK